MYLSIHIYIGGTYCLGEEDNLKVLALLEQTMVHITLGYV